MKTTKIYGPPGTGKTTFLISTLEKLLSDGYKPSEIAFVSHTKAAVEELKHRTMQRFGGSNSRDDYKWFRTLHSACCGLLGISYVEIMGWNDWRRFSKETGFEMSGKAQTDDDAGTLRYDCVRNVLSKASHQLRDYRDVALEDDMLPTDWQECVNVYTRWKADNGKVDYTDMLELAEGAVLPVKVMLVDEAQDLSDRQLNLVRSFSSQCELLYIAGDDDQAIYEFMGSSPHGFLDFEADETIVLDKSYRCSVDIGKVADKMIRKNVRRKDKAVTWNPRPGFVEHYPLSVEDMPWDKFDGQDVFVLFRHNDYLWKLQKELLKRGINSGIDGKGLTNGTLAPHVKTFLDVKRGDGATAVSISNLLKFLGFGSFASKVKKMDPKNPSRLFTKDELGEVAIWDRPMVDVFYRRDDWRHNNDVERLEKILKRHGVEVLGSKPPINLTTYHRSKGLEADTVICATDCMEIVWKEMQSNPEVERRLAYVGITRARERVIIVPPTGKAKGYMRDLVEV